MDNRNIDARVLIDKILEEYRFEKDGLLVIERIEQTYKRQSAANRLCMEEALLSWIRSEDPVRVDYAVSLLSNLGLKKALPELKHLLDEISAKTTKIPAYYAQSVQNAITKLSSSM